MAVVLHHSAASGSDKLVLLGIANHDGDGGAWPSVGTLARYANCSERAVRYSLKRLVASGELEVERQAGGNASTRPDRKPNRYRVRVECPVECAGGTQHHLRAEADCRPSVDGVKHTSERGEAGFRNGVKQAAAEPSLEPSNNVSERNGRRATIRAGWQPNPTNLESLKGKHPTLNLEDELEAFRDYWVAKGEPKADWDAALRTWCRNAERWAVRYEKPGTGHAGARKVAADRCNECAQLLSEHDQQVHNILLGIESI